jgi:hypothetical protein
MSSQMTLPDLPSATSLPESAGGHLPCASLESRRLRDAGRAVLRASLSVWLDEVSGKETNVTWLRPFSTSSQSVVLNCYLASRLERQSQKTIGSTLYSLSWKSMTTPAGRWLYQLQASTPRTREIGFTLAAWPTAAASDPSGGGSGKNAMEKMLGIKRPSGHSKSTSLRDFVQLASWPTASATDGKGGYQGGRIRNGKISLDRLDVVAQLSTWPSPCAQNGEINPIRDPLKVIARRKAGRQQNLQDVVSLCEAVRITATGEVLTGCSAGMDASGQLNPAHSRWVMGFPPVWDDCAVTAMQSSHQSPQSSWEALWKQSLRLSEAIFNNLIARKKYGSDT